jgi:acyl-CoA thioesterase FadM
MFTCKIPIRITDLNYGNHVGNDSILAILHETRVQWLQSLGYTELDFDGVGMIMKNVSIEFEKEILYGDMLLASVHALINSKVAFDVIYKLEREIHGKFETVVTAKSRMICYDYSNKKIVSIPLKVLGKLQTL